MVIGNNVRTVKQLQTGGMLPASNTTPWKAASATKVSPGQRDDGLAQARCSIKHPHQIRPKHCGPGGGATLGQGQT